MTDEDVFRPSEYTAALLRQLRLRPPCTGRVLEIGTGSGVVLAALAAQGAREVVGVDIEPEAVRRTQALLQAQAVAHATVRCGDLWTPLAGERFDLVVFNPPQLPVRDDGVAGHRLRTWSDGGPHGRDVLDRFLDGLRDHLAPQASALITHSSFVGLDLTLERLRDRGLRAEVAQTVSVPVPAWKLRLLPPRWLERHLGQSLHSVGPYVFCDFQVIEIRHADAATLAR
ncbi:HemK2/MTQ2 family protein methyltransferase [Roseateles amylovorans]|uniref:Methyltransferase n=1 Tax=Roseateles amylovorans TaxID=2978473 RepID=A0ABY6AUE6_9BURK|nr:HemK2/MTQ2 family protein methyltransferase [Roseateles amylovorans]UXH76292.1 methyltransferase [Roseateles amylovorans]